MYVWSYNKILLTHSKPNSSGKLYFPTDHRAFSPVAIHMCNLLSFKCIYMWRWRYTKYCKCCLYQKVCMCEVACFCDMYLKFAHIALCPLSCVYLNPECWLWWLSWFRYQIWCVWGVWRERELMHIKQEHFYEDINTLWWVCTCILEAYVSSILCSMQARLYDGCQLLHLRAPDNGQ